MEKNWYTSTAERIIGRNVAGRVRWFSSVSEMMRLVGGDFIRLPDASGITRIDIARPCVWHFDGEEAGWLSRTGRYFVRVSDASLFLGLYSPGFEDGDLPFYAYHSEKGRPAVSMLVASAIGLVTAKTSRMDMVNVSLPWAVSAGRWELGMAQLDRSSESLGRQAILLSRAHMLMHCERLMEGRLSEIGQEKVSRRLEAKLTLLRHQVAVTRKHFWDSIMRRGNQLEHYVDGKYISALKSDEETPLLMDYGSAAVPYWFSCYLNEKDRSLLFGQKDP